MGLPSGLLWASSNVGAEKPSDLGLYFSWGNVEGHLIGEGYDFTQEVYDSTPAADIVTNLSLDQDAARVNLDVPWRMPTANEFQELFDNCTWVWTTLNGVDGALFTSSVNGNTLFFPAAGLYNGTLLSNRGTDGHYWASTYNSETNARNLFFKSTTVNPQLNSLRRYGFTVRAVCPP